MYYIDTGTGIEVIPIQKLVNLFNQIRPTCKSFHQSSQAKETEY